MLPSSLSRRQFVLGSLAGIGLMILPSSESFGVSVTAPRKPARATRAWLHGSPRTGCGHHPGTEWECLHQPL
ncbi:MAG: hypothetical protein Kow0074_00100 [Candidatus Zixiibacteriota bacterium]